MSAGTASTRPEDKPLQAVPDRSNALSSSAESPVVISLGTRMMLWTGLVLLLSFCLCAIGTLSLARYMLRSDLEVRVARESTFLATASRDLVSSADPRGRAMLLELAKHLAEQPEILAVSVMDASRHIVAHTAKKGIPGSSSFFSLQVTIRSGNTAVGWVRAWYSPVLALQELWNSTGDLVLLLFGGTLVLFAVSLFFLNEWVLNRPFRQFFQAIDDANDHGSNIRFRQGGSDEWGILSRRLNRFLHHLSNLQERSDVLYETSRLLGAPSGIRESLDGIFTGILHRYNLSACLLLLDTGRQLLQTEFAAGVSIEFARSISIEHGQGIAGISFVSGMPRLVEDIQSAGADPLFSAMAERQQVRSALFIPLIVDGRVLGTAAYFSRTQPFTEATVDALTVFTNHVAVAFRNKRNISDLQSTNQRLESEMAAMLRELHQTNHRLVNRVRELKTVYDLALATAASTQVEDIIRVIIGGIKELVEVQGGAFFMFDKAAGLLEPVLPAFDHAGPGADPFRCRIQECHVLRQVVEKGQPQILNFIDSAEQLPASWRSLSIRSMLALPLRQGDHVEGVFCVINKVNGLFSEDDVRLLSLLTNRVTEVLHRLALDQQLRQRVHDLSVLQEIGSRLPSPPVLADTVAAIGRITRQSLRGLDMCLFFLHHAASDALVMMGGDWDPKLIFDARALTLGVSEKAPLAECFRENQPAYFHIQAKEPQWENDSLVRALGLSELIYLPLTVEQGTIGVLAIGARQTGALTEDIRRLADLIAKQVAIVVERSRLYERLRLANEKLEQINHLKNEFISMVSHELRTPLTTIKGFVSIVLNEETGPLNDQQRRFLETSDRAIDRLTLLVSDLLDISRIEAGQIKMQLRPISLAEVIQRLAASFGPQLKAQGLSLTLNLADPLPKVMADPDRIAQVLDNLLSNALKFTSQGGITISTADKGDFVMIAVKDTGSGIPKTEQDRIFEKFYQVKVANAWPSKGTGLGLAIVRSIIESHRGKVWVESDPGKGADFRFLLPRARTEAAEPPLLGKVP